MKDRSWGEIIGRIIIVVFGLATIFFSVAVYGFGLAFGSVPGLKILLGLAPLFLAGCVMIFFNNTSRGKNWIWVTVSFLVLVAYLILLNQ